MSWILPITGLIFVAVATPGPNNFIVMSVAIHRGVSASFAPILGIVVGSIGLFLLALSGIGAVVTGSLVIWIIKAAGALYLAWLGASLLRSTGFDAVTVRTLTMPQGILGLACFQFVNPKAWVLAMTVAAASSGETNGSILVVVSLGLLSATCLLAWALFGSAVSASMANPNRRIWIDRLMGGLLMISAGSLLLGDLY